MASRSPSSCASGDTLVVEQEPAPPPPSPPRLLRLVELHSPGKCREPYLLDEELLEWLCSKYALDEKPVLPIVLNGEWKTNTYILYLLVQLLEARSQTGEPPTPWESVVLTDWHGGVEALYVWSRVYFLPRPAGGGQMAVLLFFSSTGNPQRKSLASSSSYLVHTLLSSCMVNRLS